MHWLDLPHIALLAKKYMENYKVTSAVVVWVAMTVLLYNDLELTLTRVYVIATQIHYFYSHNY